MKPESVLLCLSLLGALSGVASAQQPPPAAEVDRATSDRADDLVKRGNVFGRVDRWAEAEPLFREAWSLKHSYDIAGNLGIAEAAIGKNRDAAEHLSFALRSFPANGKAEHRKLLELTFGQARAQVAALAITVAIERADIFVDGVRVGVTPLDGPIFVEPGARAIEAVLTGYKRARVQVDAAKGSSQAVEIALLPEGSPGGDERSSLGARKPVVIAGGVVGGAGVVMGAVFTVLANSKANDAATKNAALVKIGPSAACGATPSTSCQAVQSAIRDQATFGNAAVWSFIGAGVVGVGTLVYALAAPRAAKTTGVRVVPLVAAGGGGVVLQGAW